MPKLVKDETILNECIEEGYERVSSFNERHYITPETKLIIVGTITQPKGMKNGYFYTATRNPVYGFIDEALNTRLTPLKDKLADCVDGESIISQIKTILVENKIAFLDIMKNAVRVINNSEDDKIKLYSLDVDSFRNLPESVFFICNSRFAEKGYIKICKQLNRKLNYCYIPQHSRRATSEMREKIKLKWVETIKKYTAD